MCTGYLSSYDKNWKGHLSHLKLRFNSYPGWLRAVMVGHVLTTARFLPARLLPRSWRPVSHPSQLSPRIRPPRLTAPAASRLQPPHQASVPSCLLSSCTCGEAGPCCSLLLIPPSLPGHKRLLQNANVKWRLCHADCNTEQ